MAMQKWLLEDVEDVVCSTDALATPKRGGTGSDDTDLVEREMCQRGKWISEFIPENSAKSFDIS